MKNKSKKSRIRILSIFIIACMIIGLLPVGVFGESFPLETTYSGTIIGEVKPTIVYYTDNEGSESAIEGIYNEYTLTVDKTGFYIINKEDNALNAICDGIHSVIINSQNYIAPYYYIDNELISESLTGHSGIDYYYLTSGEVYKMFITVSDACDFNATIKYCESGISDKIFVYDVNEKRKVNLHNLAWLLTQDGELTITGNGDLFNEKGSMWSGLNTIINNIEIKEGITSIEPEQFVLLNNFKSISIPDTVKKIGAESFLGCSGLKEIIFHGDAPVFVNEGEESFIFSEVVATAYYPAGNSTWTPAVMQNYGGNITWVPYDDEEGTKISDAVKFVPYSETIPNAKSNAKYSLESGSLPQGISLLEDGTLEGVPKESGTFKFKVKSSSGTVSDTLILTVKDNTDGNVGGETDDGYEITQKVQDMEPDEYRNQVFEISGDGEEDLTYDEFRDLWLDGEKLVKGESLDDENIDYIAEEGSTKITIRAQTFKKAGNGRHTIAASFRNSRGQLKVATQNYTVGRKNANSGNTVTKPQPKPVDPGDDGFIDVEPTDWFYEDVKWVHDNDLMVGVGGQRFAPQGSITNGMVVTVLARIAGVDLTQFANSSYPGIEIGKWYTEPAFWARENGIIINNTFVGKGACLRGHMALMIMRYLDNLGVSYTVPDTEITIADADQMTSEELRAFEVLGKLGIFKGKKNNMMDPNGMTTRAELAALVHRLSDEIQN